MLAETQELVCFISTSPSALFPMSEMGIDRSVARVAENRVIEGVYSL